MVMFFAAASATIATGTNFDQVAQRDTNQTTGRRWIHNVGASISLFVAGVANTISMKLIAAKGKVQMQAQSGEIEVTADQAVKISSVKQDVTLAAAKDITMTSGGGYVKMGGGDIHMHCPGEFSIKCSRLVMEGAVSLVQEMPVLPVLITEDSFSQRVNFAHVIGYKPGEASILDQVPYEVRDKTGKVIAAGVTDDQGMTQRIVTEDQKDLTIFLGDGEWRILGNRITNPLS